LAGEGFSPKQRTATGLFVGVTERHANGSDTAKKIEERELPMWNLLQNLLTDS
jgi:hypothetical protein